jgi:hypothetical protein
MKHCLKSNFYPEEAMLTPRSSRYPVRGTAGGFPKLPESDHQYDLSNAGDLGRAFRNFMDASIYGTALEDLINKTAETDKLADHEPLTQAVHEFILVK